MTARRSAQTAVDPLVDSKRRPARVARLQCWTGRFLSFSASERDRTVSWVMPTGWGVTSGSHPEVEGMSMTSSAIARSVRSLPHPVAKPHDPVLRARTAGSRACGSSSRARPSRRTVSWRSVVLQPLQLCPSPFTRTPIQLKSISRHHTRGRHDCVAMIAAIDPDGPANRGSSDGRKAPIAARISASLQPNTRSTDRKCARSTSTARSLPGLL